MRHEQDTDVIRKMICYCEDIENLMHRFHYDYGTYKTDISFQYSCNMCIIQIGELVNRLSEELIEKYREIPWHAIRGMRNLHAHDYEHVDMEIVWNTLSEDIPVLKEQLENIIGMS